MNTLLDVVIWIAIGWFVGGMLLASPEAESAEMFESNSKYSICETEHNFVKHFTFDNDHMTQEQSEVVWESFEARGINMINLAGMEVDADTVETMAQVACVTSFENI